MDIKHAYVVGGMQYPWVQHVHSLTSGWAEWLPWPSLYPKQVPEGALVFFVHWSQFVPLEFTKTRTCVNFHCTKLPYGRGGHPVENLLIRRHSTTTMTAHVIDGGVDTGNILLQHVGISLAGSREDILDRFSVPVVELMHHITFDMADRTGVPQEGTPVNYTRLTDWELGEVWRKRKEGLL